MHTGGLPIRNFPPLSFSKMHHTLGETKAGFSYQTGCFLQKSESLSACLPCLFFSYYGSLPVHPEHFLCLSLPPEAPTVLFLRGSRLFDPVLPERVFYPPGVPLTWSICLLSAPGQNIPPNRITCSLAFCQMCPISRSFPAFASSLLSKLFFTVSVDFNWIRMEETTVVWYEMNMSNDSECLNLNEELWYFRGDYTTRVPTMAIFALFYVLIIVFGVIGNTCVILAITRNKTLQTVPNMFILSLSCSDIVVCCISATITPITAFKKEWIFGAALCRIAPFIAGISLCFSTFTLTAISIDRYMLIRFPMKKPLSHLQAMMVIGFICLLAASITSPIIFKQKLGPFANFCGEYCTEDWSGNESQRRLYGTALVCVQLVVPLIIIIVSYTAISLRIGQSMILKGAKKQTSDNWEAHLTDQQRMAVRRKQRTNRMLIGMVVAFSLSWFWSVSFNVLRDYDYLPDWIKDQEYLFGIATHCVAMTSTVWNPLLYAMLNLQLRAAFVDLMPECLRGYFGMTQEKSSPLIGEAASRLTHTKYGANGSTQTQTLRPIPLALSARANGGSAVSAIVDESSLAPASRPASRQSSRLSQKGSRKVSAIKVFLQTVQNDDEQLLIDTDSNSTPSSPPNETTPPSEETRRRASAASCARVTRSPEFFSMQAILVRNSSF